jgi:F0F1-type ATP synthase delta subunit
LSLQTIARRYASALAEVATERHEADEVEQEINAWAKLIDETQLREVFSNPTVPYDQKRKTLEELIARTKFERQLPPLRVLLRNQRIAQLKACRTICTGTGRAAWCRYSKSDYGTSDCGGFKSNSRTNDVGGFG